mmetsp:Transcript_22434/g.47192  ORF Transcript_22434/g.47192 Transcript_22434/m.47192 type:complete len:201 (-) Transcript_22434:2624-3226(-)
MILVHALVRVPDGERVQGPGEVVVVHAGVLQVVDGRRENDGQERQGRRVHEVVQATPGQGEGVNAGHDVCHVPAVVVGMLEHHVLDFHDEGDHLLPVQPEGRAHPSPVEEVEGQRRQRPVARQRGQLKDIKGRVSRCCQNQARDQFGLHLVQDHRIDHGGNDFQSLVAGRRRVASHQQVVVAAAAVISGAVPRGMHVVFA